MNKAPKTFSCPRAVVAATACLVAGFLAAASAQPPRAASSEATAPRLWKPVADEVYLQEVGAKILTDKPVTCVAVYSNTVYIVVGGEIKLLQDTVLADAPGAPK